MTLDGGAVFKIIIIGVCRTCSHVIEEDNTMVVKQMGHQALPYKLISPKTMSKHCVLLS